MVGKGTNPPGWKAFMASTATCKTIEERIALVKPIIEQVHTIFEEQSTQSPGSQKLFTALGVGALNNTVTGLDPASADSHRQLLAVNDVITGGDPRLAVVLLEHNFLPSLLRLHERIADMSHRLSQTVVMLVCSCTMVSGSLTSSQLEALAVRPELPQLLLSHIIYLSIHPQVLLSPAGIGTAQRCIQVCWELTRTSSQHSKAFRELLLQVDAAARLMLISTLAAGKGSGGEAAAAAASDAAATAEPSADATLGGVAALEEAGKDKPADADAAPAPAPSSSDASSAPAAPSSDPATAPDLYEQRLVLAAQASSLVANLAGLGDRNFNLTTGGLAPLRAWLLRPGTLGALRPLLERLVDGLAEVRARMEAQDADAEAEAAAEEAMAVMQLDDADLRPARLPRRRIVAQVEGALRNLLTVLGMPTIVMGTSEADVVEACGFVIRHSFGMFTEGYVDTFRALRAAVSDPLPAGAASSAPAVPFKEPYPGAYGQYFRAYAGHIETVVPALGVQLEEWGVRFTGEQAARDLPVMQVSEGVDARSAQSWLKDQIQDIVNWGHAMMQLVRMADQAAASNKTQQQQEQGDQQLQQLQQQQKQLLQQMGAAAKGHCAACGAAPPAGGPPFQSCSRCRGVRYCSRACQIGHWTQHKADCQARTAAAAAETG
ncbi:hypothetical protein Agub_g14993, partial [Astrephomene gubernaculifera]